MTACMDALAAGGKWSETIKLLDEMRSKGIAPNERTYKVRREIVQGSSRDRARFVERTCKVRMSREPTR